MVNSSKAVNHKTLEADFLLCRLLDTRSKRGAYFCRRKNLILGGTRMAYLGTRSTSNNLCKVTSMRRREVGGKEAICFYSSYDECGYVYPGFSVRDAVEEYEKDTKYQGFAEIAYFTEDEFIKESFKEEVHYER